MAPAMSSIDEEELRKFEATADAWWDETGPLAALHRLNPLRIAFIRDAALGGRAGSASRPLSGLRILDVGCGGGLLAEPLARLGAEITGIDLVAASLDVARTHAAASGLEIDYRLEPADALAARGERFDVVVASEVVEHVPDQRAFVQTLATLGADDGVVCLSTINRTWRSYAEAIVGAEHVLGWLPSGTHSWRRFVRPSELAGWLRRGGFVVDRLVGVGLDLGSGTFVERADLAVNYMASARRA